MASWEAIRIAAPEFATQVQARFDSGRHKTLATLRHDGGPRISGIEASFALGELWFGSMTQAVKARDLQRDPRFALHSPTGELTDPASWPGDAKLSGRVEEITDPVRIAEVAEAMGGEAEPPGSSHLYRADITEVVLTRLGEPADHLVIESWTEDGGFQRRMRH